MLDKLVQKLQSLQISQIPFDPAQFGDPIAMETRWTHARGGGSNFRTYKLVKINPFRVEFKSTVGAIIFSLLFALPGFGLLILMIPNVDWSSMTPETVIPLLLGLVFASLGSFLFYSQMLPIVFDRQEGLFWKKRKPQAGMMVNETNATFARLETVHALQIVAEYITGKNGGYYSYELNLVLNDARRINLIDHGKRSKILEDAAMLGEFLGVPVWDATMTRIPSHSVSTTISQ